jgi:23S rRNA pseudouridine1911/1915/1917 synthase
MGDDTGTGGDAAHRELVATTAGRVDAVLAAAWPDLSRARLQRLIAAGQATVNSKPVRKSVQVDPGDRIAIDLPAYVHEAPAAIPELSVLYEDAVIVAVNKPAGLAVHGAPGDTGPTLAAWFLARYPAEAEAFDAEHPGIVHRLDKNTTGVLLLAKTPEAQAAISRAFEARTTRKTYVAICDGIPAKPRAVIDAAIGRHTGDRTRMSIARQGRDARTEYETLATGWGQSLLLVHPVTGRTHQIRVHLAAIGAAVAADKVYGKAGAGRQLLHAWQVTVPHPDGGTLTVTAPLPADMQDAVRAMGAEKIGLPYTIATPAVRQAAEEGETPSTEAGN